MTGAGTRSIITLTDRLKAEMPKMLSEHKAIVAPRPPDCCGCLVKHIPFRPRATRASCFEIIMSQKVLVTGAASGIGLEMARVDGVVSVHDLHVWTLSGSRSALSAHVVVSSMRDWDRTLHALQGCLHEKFGIDHVTLQPESDARPLVRH